MSGHICVDVEVTSLRCLLFTNVSVINITLSSQLPFVNKSQVYDITTPSFPIWDPCHSIFNKMMTYVSDWIRLFLPPPHKLVGLYELFSMTICSSGYEV